MLMLILIVSATLIIYPPRPIWCKYKTVTVPTLTLTLTLTQILVLILNPDLPLGPPNGFHAP